jgi:hypothetical protein
MLLKEAMEGTGNLHRRGYAAQELLKFDRLLFLLYF